MKIKKNYVLRFLWNEERLSDDFNVHSKCLMQQVTSNRENMLQPSTFKAKI